MADKMAYHWALAGILFTGFIWINASIFNPPRDWHDKLVIFTQACFSIGALCRALEAYWEAKAKEKSCPPTHGLL